MLVRAIAPLALVAIALTLADSRAADAQGANGAFGVWRALYFAVMMGEASRT